MFEIIREVSKLTVVMIDGEIRQGTDVFKALALGAKLVLVGRPVIWGLAVDGQIGVEYTLEILKKELDVAMGRVGAPSIKSINKEMVVEVKTKTCVVL